MIGAPEEAISKDSEALEHQPVAAVTSGFWGMRSIPTTAARASASRASDPGSPRRSGPKPPAANGLTGSPQFGHLSISRGTFALSAARLWTGSARQAVAWPDDRDRFLALHQGDTPLLLPNPWDAGSAKLLASMGFQALATTSSGLPRRSGASTAGDPRRGDRSRRVHRRLDLAARVRRPRERLRGRSGRRRADDPAGRRRGLAGCSVEDHSGPGTRRSTTSGSRPSGSPRPPRPPMQASRWCSPAAPRTTCTASRPVRHHRPPAGLPGRRRGRALRARPESSRTSAPSSPASTGRSTCSPARESRRCRSWPRSGSRGSRSAVPSRSRRSARSSRPGGS